MPIARGSAGPNAKPSITGLIEPHVVGKELHGPPLRRRTTNDERRTTNDERRTTNDERRTTNDERRKTTSRFASLDRHHRVSYRSHWARWDALRKRPSLPPSRNALAPRKNDQTHGHGRVAT